MWVTPKNSEDTAAYSYNAESQRILAMHLRRERGIKSKSIGKYVSQLRSVQEESLDMRLTQRGVGFRYGQLLQQMRREDGPAGERELQRALRACHLAALADPTRGFDTTSRLGLVRLAMIHAGHQALLRGWRGGAHDAQRGVRGVPAH